MDVLGIDISKGDFHAHLLQTQGAGKKSFPNTPTGYRQLRAWLKNHRCTDVHVCMEATGAYWLGLASAVHQWGVAVSVVNPNRTAQFARSQLRRTKTDRSDAEMIAQFCQTQRLQLWIPPSPQTLELRGLLTYRDHLVGEGIRLRQVVQQVYVGKELKRLHAKQIKSLDQSLESIEKQLRKMVAQNAPLGAQVVALTAIEGIGFITAVAIIAKLPMEQLRNGKAAAAYVGLTPSDRQSGTSVNGKPRICKTGNAGLRKDLYMPALVAQRHNPILRAFAERLGAKGKPKKVVVVAVMRKLIVLAFSVLNAVSASQPVLA